MDRELIRSVLDIVDDPHAFAEAYTRYVTRHRLSVGDRPPVVRAAHQYVTTGRIF